MKIPSAILLFFLEAHDTIAFTLHTERGECFRVKRHCNHATVVQSSYLNSLEPESPKGNAPASYMAKIKTNPKPSTVSNYLDSVGDAPPAVSPPAPIQESSPPATSAYASSTPASTDDPPFPHSHNYKYTYTQTNPPQKVSYRHTQSIYQKIDRKADAAPVVQPVPVVKPEPVPIADLSDEPLTPAPPALAVTDYTASSFPPIEPVVPASTVSTPAPSSGDYLSALSSNVMSSGGGGAGPANYLSNLGSNTKSQPSGGSNLGSSYLDNVASAKPVTNDYSTTPVQSTPPPVQTTPPVATTPPATESTPAPSSGDYLSALGSNVMSKGSGGTGPASYLSNLGSNAMSKPKGGSNLGSSYLDNVASAAPVVNDYSTTPVLKTPTGSIDQRFEAAKPHLSSLVEQVEETSSAITETVTTEAELIPTANNHAYDTFISGLKIVTTDMGKSMREAVDILARSGENIAASIKRSSVTLAASNIIGNDGLNDDDMENRLALLKRTVDEMK